MSLSKKNLVQCFENAVNTNALFIGVKISTRGSEGCEYIINPRENFKVKLDYYRKSYTDNLVLKTYDGIQIVACCYGDCFDELECQFEEDRLDD